MAIRIPRITIHADYADETAFGDLNLLSLGYSFHLSWIYAVMFASNDIFAVPQLPVGLFGIHSSLMYFSSIVTFGVFLIVMAITEKRMHRLFIFTKTLIAGSFLMFAGTLVLLLSSYLFVDKTIVELTAGILTGLGSALMTQFWGIAFSRCTSASIVLNGVFSIAIGFFVYALILRELPFPASAALTSCMPLFEMMILLLRIKSSPIDTDGVRSFKSIPVKRWRFFGNFGTPVFLLGLALGMLRQTSIQSILPATDPSQRVFIALASCCAVLVILLTVMAVGGTGRWSSYFRPLVPLIATSTCLLIMPDNNLIGTQVSNFFILVSYMCFEALMWIFFGELAHRFSLSPILVFGLGRGLMALGSAIGSIMQSSAGNWPEYFSLNEQMGVMLILVVLFVAYALLPSERKIAASIAPCPLVISVSAQLDENSRLHSVTYTPPNTDFGSTSHTEGEADSSSAEALNPERKKSSRKPLSSHDQGVDIRTDPVAFKPQDDGSMAPVAMPTNPPNTLLSATTRSTVAARENTTPSLGQIPSNVFQTAVNSANGSSTTQNNRPADAASNPDGQTNFVGRYRKKCNNVARTFLLSERESEVMFLLAKGYNSARIQERLYISEGTAKTHIRHIYRKLDVHSQQELIKLVESFD